ncbi:helix-turn-helix transcriptional regulator [Pelotomaculum propionicicum]|uniref:helix-turn-helix transcriptional regulator n=1 Tax=Pelotomaculum propionicicum TaxID=258475 RepID=UPI003B7AAE26
MKNVKFKELRQRGGYTQAALGRVFGITPDYVNIIENGRQTPGFVLAKRIADFFGVTVDELFFCEPKEQNVQKSAADCMYGRCCYAAKFGSCE